MDWHRLLCALGCHYFVRLGQGWRGCCVCNQQQRYLEDVRGMHGFWMNVRPQGAVKEA